MQPHVCVNLSLSLSLSLSQNSCFLCLNQELPNKKDKHDYAHECTHCIDAPDTPAISSAMSAHVVYMTKCSDVQLVATESCNIWCRTRCS